ncbi:MAG TPA: outer membrane protein assembly factor BamD [Bacteroidota bacterium]
MKILAAGILILSATLLSGCGSSEPTEQLGAEKRFEAGMKLFHNADYLDAIEEFKIVTLQFQGSVVADAAQFYLAECRFMREEYILAAYEYDQLVRTMPTSRFVTTARYKRALCYYKLSPPSYLDQTYTRKAIDEFQGYIEYSPTDSLVHDAEARIMELNTKLAEKEYNDGVIYTRMEYYRAAQVYFESVLEKYHDTPYAELAQLKKAEVLNDRKKPADAMKELELFYRKYPNSQHKEEADKLLADIRRKIAEEKTQPEKSQQKKDETAGKSRQTN